MLSAGSTLNLTTTLLLTSWLVISIGESKRLASEQLARCRAANKSETICALKTEADKYLEWTWFERDDTLKLVNSSTEADGYSRVVLDGTLRLGVGKSAFALDINKLRANAKVVHKAEVFLPFRPVTSDNRCEFSLSYRVNERSSYVTSMLQTQATQNDPNYSWPKVSVVLVRPRSDEKHNVSEHQAASLAEVHLLNHFERLGSYLANEFDSTMLIGHQMAGSWRLAILVETRLDANFLEFTRMELINCEPTGEEMATFALDNNLRELIDLEEAFANTCNEAGFQCRLSGRCLSLDLRCDFGHDCGPLDDSDEFRCSADFEGRCDFEEDSDLCEWAALPRGAGNSWTWTSAADHTGAIRHKPPLDHSLQTPGQGHYLLLEAHQLDSPAGKQLIGPRVQLKPGHPDCKFRFWLHVPESLRSVSLRSSLLKVGYEQIGPADLFDEAGSKLKGRREENNWRRFQVTLLDERLQRHNESLFALHISFGNFSKDLELLSLADAYLSLDDFSFSPGCALTFYNKPPGNICGDTEFQCDFAPPEAPKQFCLPSNRVCDFKNDCQHHEELSASGWSLSAASDEAHCMSWFSVERSSSFVGLELSGLQVVNHATDGGGNSSDQSASLEVNEAFELELPRAGPVLGPFRFRAQCDKFMRNFHNRTSAMRHATETGILLPRFHQAHANCRLRLTYAWDRNSRNLLASIHVIRSGVSTLYRRWSCGADLAASEEADKFSLLLGLGEQNSPFSVQLRVSVESLEIVNNSLAGHEFAGWFSLMSYDFESCAHQAGQVNVPQAQTIPIGDVDDESDREDEYRHGPSGATNRAADEPLFRCAETQFQCRKPILCLDERFVCDKQRDCQESGADENDCAAKGFIQYDFEDHDRLEGWRPSLQVVGMENSSAWLVESSAEFGFDPSLPPVDHTLARASGHFLSLRDNEVVAAEGTRVASIVTPTFEVLGTCKRLVVYIYGTSMRFGQPAYSFSIAYFDALGKSRDEITLRPDGIPIADEKVDGWRRLEFDLPHAGDCRECLQASKFAVNIYASRGPLGSPGKIRKLALDDMTLGPKCLLSKDNRSHWPKPTANNPSLWFWYRLTGFMLLAIGFCSIGLLVYVVESRRTTSDERPGAGEEENYVPLGRLD